MLGNTANSIFGCTFRVPTSQFSSPFLSASSVYPIPYTRLSEEINLVVKLRCNITYLDLQILRPDQLDYYYGFKALQELIPEQVRLAYLGCSFSPCEAHQRRVALSLPNNVDGRAAKLRSLLIKWIDPTPYDPICRIGSFQP